LHDTPGPGGINFEFVMLPCYGLRRDDACFIAIYNPELSKKNPCRFARQRLCGDEHWISMIMHSRTGQTVTKKPLLLV
jgi:hypothetical protein